METYTVFSKLYDILMDDVPYEKWVENIESIWDNYKLNPELVLDLCCGSGNITAILDQKGYDMIGVDLSVDMLMQARNKLPETLLLNQDMTSFELYGLVDSILCLCDSMNYLLEEEDLLKTFKCCSKYLVDDGLLIFDMNTKYKFQHQLGSNTFAEQFEDFSYIWENCFDESKNIHEYHTTFFIKTAGNKYEKFEEFHYEKFYNINVVQDLIQKSGLKLEGVFDESLYQKPNNESQRIYFVCRKV